MIRKAGERLGTNNVGGSAVDQLQHFSGKKPPFSGLVAQRNNVGCHPSELLNTYRRSEMPALCKGLRCRSTEPFQRLNSKIGKRRLFLGKTELFYLEVLVVEAVV